MFGRKKKLGEFIFDYIHAQGVKKAFGIPGDFVLPTFRYLQASPIDIITMTHEPSVGFAADCYARSTGLGLAVVTYCVGGLNMLNSIACAYAEKSPVIVISGGPSPKDRHKDPMVHHKVRTFDTQRRIFEEVTCANTVINDPETAVLEIMRVVEEVKLQSRPGYIEIPFDMVDAEIAIPKHGFEPEIHKSDPESLNACIEEITEKINSSKQPVIIAGVELHRHNLTDLAADLAKKHNIPIAATLLGKSVVRETNPLYIGVYSGAISEPICAKYVDESDCVILLGAFLSDILLGFQSEALDRTKSIVLGSDAANVGFHQFEDIKFDEILEGLLGANIKHRSEFVNPNPIQLYEPINASEKTEQLDVESLFRILSIHIAEGDTVVSDTGDALVGAIGIRTGTRSHFFSDAYYLSMGFAAPAAIGAIAANPEGKTFAIIGDGAFQMTGMELSTAAKYNMAPVVIVINNDGYGTQRHIIDGPFNNIHMWNYAKISDFLNYGKSVKVTTKGEFDQAIKEAKEFDELYFIEAVVERDDCSSSLQRMGEAIGKLRDPSKK